jgi:hypothetical protein
MTKMLYFVLKEYITDILLHLDVFLYLNYLLLYLCEMSLQRYVIRIISQNILCARNYGIS